MVTKSKKRQRRKAGGVTEKERESRENIWGEELGRVKVFWLKSEELRGDEGVLVCGCQCVGCVSEECEPWLD